jgi:hypothetical protein
VSDTPQSNIADPEQPPANITEPDPEPEASTPGDSSVPTVTETFAPVDGSPTESVSTGTTETTMPVVDDPQAVADAAQAEANAHPSVSADNPPA